MRFVWDEVNEAELAAHGIDKATAEAVFLADDCGIIPDPETPNRFIAEGRVEGRMHRVAFPNVFPEGIRITTAFRIATKRRRT